MDLTEKCLESREVYKGRVLRLRVDTVAWGSWPWTKTAAFPW